MRLVAGLGERNGCLGLVVQGSLRGPGQAERDEAEVERAPRRCLRQNTQQRHDQRQHGELPGLHTEIEQRQGGRRAIRWDTDLLQRAGEAEAVDEAKCEREIVAAAMLATEAIL